LCCGASSQDAFEKREFAMSSPRTESPDFHWMNYAEEYIAVVQGSFRGMHGEFRLLDLPDCRVSTATDLAQNDRHEAMQTGAYSLAIVCSTDDR
jgi:hypothetical protein